MKSKGVREARKGYKALTSIGRNFIKIQPSAAFAIFQTVAGQSMLQLAPILPVHCKTRTLHEDYISSQHRD
ncbi:MAG: hypothetical protein DYG89_49105 [Caldilinea sp. CFX5]|nr:hypothetical protein [Caldilinea sp. CFX5]